MSDSSSGKDNAHRIAITLKALSRGTTPRGVEYTAAERQKFVTWLMDDIESFGKCRTLLASQAQGESQVTSLKEELEAIQSQIREEMDEMLSDLKEGVRRQSDTIAIERQSLLTDRDQSLAAIATAKQDLDHDIALSRKSGVELATKADNVKLLFKEDVNRLIDDAKKSVVDATRSVQDEKSKVVDAIALHTANAIRQIPTLAGLIQAVTSLQSISPATQSSSIATPTKDESQCCKSVAARLSALEATVNKDKKESEKVVESKIAAALAKQEQKHQQVLDSLIQPKLDKSLAKVTLRDQQVLDNLVQSKVDKAVAQVPKRDQQTLDNLISSKIDKAIIKQDQRSKKDLEALRSELISSQNKVEDDSSEHEEVVKVLKEIKIEESKAANDKVLVNAAAKACTEQCAKREERYQQDLRDHRVRLQKCEDAVDGMQSSMTEGLARQEERHSKAISFLSEGIRDGERDAEDYESKTTERVDQVEEAFNGVLQVIRHDILDLAHSFVELKSSIGDIPDTSRHDRTKLVQNVEKKLAHLSKLPAPELDDAQSDTLLTSNTRPLSETQPRNTKVHVMDVESDDEDFPSLVSEISEDGFCVMEPSRAELAINVSQAVDTVDRDSEPFSPAPSTFDNNGPLALGSSHLRALMTATLAVPALETGMDLSSPGNEFNEIYFYYCRHMSGPMDLLSLWAAFKELMLPDEPATLASVGPPMWEGAGLLPGGSKRMQAKTRRMNESQGGESSKGGGDKHEKRNKGKKKRDMRNQIAEDFN